MLAVSSWKAYICLLGLFIKMRKLCVGEGSQKLEISCRTNVQPGLNQKLRLVP